MCVCVYIYHNFVCVILFSVIKDLMSSIVENNRHSLWSACSSQHLETQSAGQLTCCQTNLNPLTHRQFKKGNSSMNLYRHESNRKNKVYPSTGSVYQYDLSSLDVSPGTHNTLKSQQLSAVIFIHQQTQSSKTVHRFIF